MSRVSPAATVPATVIGAPPLSPDRLSCAANPPASGFLRSTTVIPRALARAAALTRLTRWVVDVSIIPRRTAAVERRRVERGQLAGDVERDRPDAAARELGEEPAEQLGQRQVRRQGPGRLRREERGVHRVPSRAPGEDLEDLVGDLLGDEDLGLRGRRPEMRGQDRVRRLEERRSGRRLVLEHVDPGAAEPAAREALGDGGLVEDAAAGDVQEDRRRAASGRSGRARSGRGSSGSAGRGR